MKYFKCSGCGWRYVFTRRKVFGPIFEDYDASAARIMTRKECKDQYADCFDNLRKTNG